MKNWLRNGLRKFLGITEDNKRNAAELQRLSKLFREQVQIGVDVSYSKHGTSWVIVVGRHQGRDHVQAFSVRNEDFSMFVRQLKDMEKRGRLIHVDAPPEFRACYDRF